MQVAGKVNILLVDDQPARLLTYESILASSDQNLVTARSGLEALEQLMREEFAVVLLDVSMPDMDGFEAARLIHEHPRFERTPIIFVTGVHMSASSIGCKGYKLGAVDYVSIPVVPEILRSKVAVLVELYLQAARAARAQPQPGRGQRAARRRRTPRCRRRRRASSRRSTRAAAGEPDAGARQSQRCRPK